jgi:hypothetical protein
LGDAARVDIASKKGDSEPTWRVATWRVAKALRFVLIVNGVALLLLLLTVWHIVASR